jgi:hypothetical protein
MIYRLLHIKKWNCMSQSVYLDSKPGRFPPPDEEIRQRFGWDTRIAVMHIPNVDQWKAVRGGESRAGFG